MYARFERDRPQSRRADNHSEEARDGAPDGTLRCGPCLIGLAGTRRRGPVKGHLHIVIGRSDIHGVGQPKILLHRLRQRGAQRVHGYLSQAHLAYVYLRKVSSRGRKSFEGRPWAEWKVGKPMSANVLARLLAPYEIKPETIRTGDRTPKGYRLAQFEDAFSRYLHQEGQ